MEDAYRIIGGRQLKGSVWLSGAKNVALKTIIASLLFEGKVILHNVPRIKDVTELLHLIGLLGVRAEFTEKNTVEIDSSSIQRNKVDLLHATKIRVSFMLFAPLLHKFDTCYVPNPGGCRIGARPIDRIISGMKKLGVEVVYNSETGYYEAKKNELGGEYTFSKPTHTGTELLIMLASLGTHTITLHNAAYEPEIDDLIAFLNEAGADISRVGSRVEIKGVSKLEQRKPFTIVSDRNEAVTFAVMGCATKGEVIIENIQENLIENFLKVYTEARGGVEKLGPNRFKFFAQGDCMSTNIETAPHPGFMTDWQPNWAVLMTQAQGVSMIHERVFENRFAYVNELRKLGAKIDYIPEPVENPEHYYHFTYDKNKYYQQAIRIVGPTRLHNGVLTIHDLRAGASLVIASLIASGESIVQGVSIVERGYENLVEKIKGLGGEIDKI